MSSAGDSPAMELVAAAPVDDSRAREERLTRLFHKHGDFVWRAARRSGLSVAEADDATQQVFLVVSRKLASIVPGQEQAFLFGTTTNIARTMVRARTRRREELGAAVEAEDTSGGPEEMLEEEQRRETVHRILESMPEDIRAAFVLFELEEMTALEVSLMLGIPGGTVASRVRRGREIFRAALGAMEGR
jgi:RNA polymerase sigma-70 factor (ECF subfamily)